MPMNFAHKPFGTFFRAPLCVPLFVALDRKWPVSHSLSWFFRCVSVEKMSVYLGGGGGGGSNMEQTGMLVGNFEFNPVKETHLGVP